ncbi:acetoacetate-CoA ligase [Fusarium austroafricanum]|uniref:Acetoacetate-CoA ligase n=1 Tax=Fusarium austroafricanum TaxID=2364996 RepID=A0A8H4KJP6_9HYPO|nr:acetoacetate-CoA ligase [Fusarium austroafricanum]
MTKPTAQDVTVRKLWEPSRPEDTQLYQFMQKINHVHGLSIESYWDLYDYSVSNLAQFWSDAFEYAQLIHSGSYERAVDESQPIDATPKWFEGVNLNIAENILFSRDLDSKKDSRGLVRKEDEKIAITEVSEGGTTIRHLNWAALRRDTSLLASALKARGVVRGDRVFAVVSNSYQTLTLFLAVAWVGGIFASTSPDMGADSILKRAKQIGPKLVFMDDSTRYNGRDVDIVPKASNVLTNLSEEATFQSLILIPRGGRGETPSLPTDGFELLDKFLSHGQAEFPPVERLPFHAPCLISYSSGTTGEPKCIVHSVGGLLINSAKESVLHGDLRPNDTFFQYTTTGWIMYVACVTALMPGARTVLYDGSPFFPDPTAFIKLLSSEKVTSLGISPRWMFEMLKLGISPQKVADLSSLKVVSSTGMVLSDQLFEWFYDVGFPKHVRLANMSGGTDIAGCFALGNPISPLYVGGCQGPALGIAISVFDTEVADPSGKSVVPGQSGELVAYKPFPNVPVFFWNDGPSKNSPESRYFTSYFAKYNHVWAHGDFVSIHPTTRAVVFHGRADGVLNPSGIRFGSSEIYSIIERYFSDIVMDSICVGQRRANDPDETVLLYVVMKPGHKFTTNVMQDIKDAIKKDLSSRHVPKHIFEAPEIPVTATFKKVELPVKHIVSGRKVKPSTTIVNPHSLDFFYQFADTKSYPIKAKI